MPKPFEGHWPKGGQGLGAGYVNVTPPRFVDVGAREIFNEEQINRRSGARDSGGQRNGKNEMGGR
jgi:hypothetical protein